MDSMSPKNISSERPEALERMFLSSQGSARLDLALQIADWYIARSRYQEALSFLEAVSELAQELGRLSLLNQKLGRIHLRLSRYDQAYHYLGQALTQLGQSPDRLELFMVYHDLAWLFYRQGQLVKARSHLEGAELAIDLRSEKEPGIEAARADLLHVSALIEAASANHDLALNLLEDEKQIRQRLGDDSGLSAVYNKISSVYQAKGDIIKARVFQEQALKLAKSCGDLFRVAVSEKNLGEINHSLGFLDRAEDCYQRSLEISLEIGNRLGEVFAHAGLGRILTSRARYPQAEESLLRALEISREIGGLEQETSTLVDLADLYCCWNKLGLAEKYIEEAESLNNERDHFLPARHQIVAARVLFKSGRAQQLSQARLILEGLVAHPLLVDDEESLSATELEIQAHLILSQTLAKLGFRSRAQTAAAKSLALIASFSYGFDEETKEAFFSKPEIGRAFAWQKELG